MKKKLFGTDGIRGTANKFPMTAEIALKVGAATGAYFRNNNKDLKDHKVVIGKDTRLSGYMIEPALTAGLISMGMNVVLVGPMPTPAVAMLTRSMRADLGIMISASHNHYQDNGIKLFDAKGIKLSDEVENKIEALIDEGVESYLAGSSCLGRAKRLDDAIGRYIQHVKGTFPKNESLAGLKIVVDCANGAAYKIAPLIMWELEAQLITINNEPNGFNINENCGSTSCEQMCREVIKHKADIGIAFDGDADRLSVCDELGNVINGDQILALIACYSKKAGKLNKDSLVATDMSNMGLEEYLKKQNIKLYRTGIGDRYVSEFMDKNNYNVGGEQSGHIILSDYSSTGDGLIAALQILSALKKSKLKASQLLQIFTPYPQILKNIKFNDINPLQNKEVIKFIEKESEDIKNKGRILVRKSGTEPLIRVMVEAKDQIKVDKIADKIVNFISNYI